MESHEEASSLVRRLRAAIMVFAVCAALFILLGRLPEIRQTLVRIHYLGLTVLFAFLAAGEVCHLRILHLVRKARWHLVARTAHVWRVLTEFLPGAAALVILSSGLRLIYEGNHSLGKAWLFVLVAGFGYFFADGLRWYTPQIARLDALGAMLNEGESRAELRSKVRSLGFNLSLLLHFTSMPLLYAVGRWKPLPMPSLLHDTVSAVDRFLLPFAGRATGVVTALSLIALEGVIVSLARRTDLKKEP